MKNIGYIVLLLFVSIIWGAAFVAQSMGMDSIPPFWLNGIRMTLAAIVLIPVYKIVDKKKHFEREEERQKYNKLGLVVGCILGIFLFAASSFQNYGILGSGAGKSGFITSLYIVFVPIISLIFKEKISWNVLVSIVIAVIGLFLLCIKESITSISISDFYLMICALFFAFQIILVGKYSPKSNGIKLSCYQCLVCGVLSIICGLIFESITFEAVIEGIGAILYLGLLSSGVAYTLQVVAQKEVNPTIASLVMSLESVFAVLFGVLILNESLTVQEMIGCIIIFLAIILSQLPFKSREKKVK